MVEHTRTHLWVNTLIAVAALVASGVSSVLTWWNYSLKSEALGFDTSKASSCRLDVDPRKVGHIGICWKITISNRSDSRTSIIRYQTSEIFSDAPSLEIPGNRPDMEYMDGSSTSTPIVLEGGESKSYIVRVRFLFSGRLGDVYGALFTGSTNTTLSMFDAEKAACTAGFDLIGNEIKRDDCGFNYPAWTHYNVRPYQREGRFRVWTGRGNFFDLRLTYPQLD